MPEVDKKTDSVQDVKTTSTESSDMDLLNKLAQKDVNPQNFEQAMTEIITLLAVHAHADHGYVMTKESDDELANVASIHRNGHDDPLVTVSNALVDKVVSTKTGVVINDAMNNQEFAGDPNFQRFNVNSVICVPLKTGDTVLGLIYLDNNSSRENWDEQLYNLIEFAGHYLGLAVSNINLNKAVEENRRLAEAGRATLQLSHSVKNILQMVGGASEVVDFGLRTNEIHRVKRSWDILKPNIERLRKFTLDMLDYSKERNIEPGACDFNRVIQGAIESLKDQLKQTKSKLNIRIDQTIPKIELDGERIHEMALNLILNALDIVDDTNGVVSVETKYLPREQEVKLVVSDNGPGISEAMKDKIFTPFESDKNKFGTGLGMPIAKQIVDQHNGRIEIETETGKGTAFHVIFPAKLI